MATTKRKVYFLIMTKYKSNAVRLRQAERIQRLFDWEIHTTINPFLTRKETMEYIPVRLRARYAYVCDVVDALYAIANTWSDPQLSRYAFL
jgi:hypothetical protein